MNKHCIVSVKRHIFLFHFLFFLHGGEFVTRHFTISGVFRYGDRKPEIEYYYSRCSRPVLQKLVCNHSTPKSVLRCFKLKLLKLFKNQCIAFLILILNNRMMNENENNDLCALVLTSDNSCDL